MADKYLGCVDNNIWYNEWPSARIVRMQSQWPGKYLASVLLSEYLTNKQIVETV